MKSVLRSYVDEKYKVLLKTMRTETITKVSKEVNEKLQVPGLIGDNQVYPTLSNYLLMNNTETKNALMISRT